MTGQRRCYIHVGMPKTGTSYLQSIFWQSGDALAAQDLQMLPASATDTFHMMLGLRGQLRADLDPPAAFAALDRFREAAAADPSRTALVSQELLGALSPDQVRTFLQALSKYEPHVIVTVRDLASFAPSAWQEHVKARGTKPFDTYLADLLSVGSRGPRTVSYDLHGVLDRWGAHVPPEHLHVVTVPRRGAPQRVLLDRFCSVLGIDPSTLDAVNPKTNTSLGLVQAELLRRVNVALGDRLPHRRAGYREQGKRFLAGKILQQQRGRPPLVPKRLEDVFAAASENTVARIQADGYDVIGDLADLLPDPSAFAEVSNEVSDAQVAEAATEALAAILHNRAEERRNVQRLRSRVREQQRLIDQDSSSSGLRRAAKAVRTVLRRR